MQNRTRFLTKAAIIAALYVALTMFISALSFGPVQVRFGEALTVLPYYSFAAVPGLFVGCIIANLIGAVQGLTPFLDVIIGSLATLVAAFLSYKLRNYKYLVPLPPVIVNALVVGAQMKYFWGVPLPLWTCISQVFIGQAVACYGLGLLIIFAIDKSQRLRELVCDY